MCSDFSPSPFLFSDQNKDTSHLISPLPCKHKKGIIGNIAASLGGTDIESILAAMPSLDLNTEDVLPPPVSSVLHTPCPYNLRSLGGKPGLSGSVGGIGQLPPQGHTKNKRGSKSDLSKDKLKAKFDVADRKQQSITGVLRAVQTPENVIK